MARTRLTVPGTPVGDVALAIVSPTGSRRRDELPLLVVHHGPEYSRKAHLFKVIRGWYAAGLVPPQRVAPLEPGSRNERYAANSD